MPVGLFEVHFFVEKFFFSIFFKFEIQFLAGSATYPKTEDPKWKWNRPTGPKNLNFSTTSDSHFYFFNGLFGGWKEPNRRGFIQIGPYKPLKRAPKDDFF